jgi:subtilisin family serine protease
MSHMRTLLLAAAVVGVAACSDDAVQPDAGSSPADFSLRGLRVASGPEQVMPGEVIVKLKAGVDAATVGKAHGLAMSGRGYQDAFVVLKGAAGAEHATAAALRKDGRVVYAEPNYLRQPTAINPSLWAFYNPGGLNMKFTTGKSKGLPIPSSYASTSDADEDNIEGYAAGGSDVVIGSIDTGVDMDHPEFTGRLIGGKDWYSNDNDPNDEEGHGTHTTGTMAGATVGVAGVSGASSHVKVYVQRVCGRRGCPTAAIVSAIRAAADYNSVVGTANGMMVAMNLSLGGSSESQAEKDAIAYALSKEVLVIASAGNNGTSTVSCPACDVNAISVASTTWRDELASYSNSGTGIDISAPGGNCFSNTTPEGCIYSAFLNGGYEWLQGTSMAAPQVTGTAAIVASKVAAARGHASVLRGRLETSADDKGAAGYDTKFGNGRLNSYRAVTGNSLASGL